MKELEAGKVSNKTKFLEFEKQNGIKHCQKPL